MAKIPGSVAVTGVIAPKDDADTYAVTDQEYHKGGYRSVVDNAARDAILSTGRVVEGMMIRVNSDGKFYTLDSSLTTWTEYIGGEPSIISSYEEFKAAMALVKGTPTNAAPVSYFLAETILVPDSETIVVNGYSDRLMYGAFIRFGEDVVIDGVSVMQFHNPVNFAYNATLTLNNSIVVTTLSGTFTLAGTSVLTYERLSDTSLITLAGTAAISQSFWDNTNKLQSIDEDDLASDSDTKVPTQQSVKAYIDSRNVNLNGFGTTLNRPVTPTNGESYFDSTLGYNIWYNSIAWVNAIGAIV
jgi:hypothetical protein